MTVDVKSKIYAVVWDGNDPDVALFSKQEDAIREIEAYTGKKFEEWEFNDGAVVDDEDRAMFIRECELN